MELTYRWEGSIAPGRTLFVVFAYHGADRDGQRQGFLEQRESANARGHRIVHRDHYANPRPLPYQMAMVEAAIAVLSPEAPPDLVIDTRVPGALPGEISSRFARITSADVTGGALATGALGQSRDYDHIVLVYADALGLGCERGELDALAGRESVLVINGRRRAFRLDQSRRRRIRLSRWLAHTRLVERALALAMRPLAGAMAGWDQMTGKAS
jgi:hypothetical protein